MTLLSGAETYAVLAQGQLATSVGTLYTVAASTTAFIKQIMLVNTTGSIVTGVILFANGTSAGNQITGSIMIPANGTVMIDDDGMAVYDDNGWWWLSLNECQQYWNSSHRCLSFQ